MKQKNAFLAVPYLLFVSGCVVSQPDDANVSFSEPSVMTSETSGPSSEPVSSERSSAVSSTQAKTSEITSEVPKKVTIAAHTLKDNNPPININSMGQIIDEDTWNSFRYGGTSVFNGNYNYTYHAYSGGYETYEAFTKNGYYMRTFSGKSYYEREGGSKFYTYMSTKEGYLRQETTFDLQSKYTSRIVNEIYVHMFDFSEYFYDDYDGTYRYYGSGFSAAAKFQDGYLTYLYYILGMNFFEIDATFDTTIDIPESYYYE